MATHTIWPQLSPELGQDILLTIQKENKKLYRTAIEILAPQMRIRVPLLLEMPKQKRHAAWIQILGHPAMEVLGFNLLSAWLISSQRPMLCAWLDSLGIPHGDNGCADDFPAEPDSALLKKGIDQLLTQFDPTHVSIYLRTFNEIDETHWPALKEIIDKDPRLQLLKPVSA